MKYLSIKDVSVLTTLSASTIRRKEKEGLFPASRPILNELAFQVEKALSYEVSVGGEVVESNGKEFRKGGRRYRAKRVVEYLPAINCEICPNLKTTLIDGAPTSVAALGLNDIAEDVGKSDTKIDAGRVWPVIEDKPGTGTNNRFKVLRLLSDIAASSAGKMFVAAKKTMLGWCRNKLGKDGQDTFDLLSFGRTAGTNKFEGHSTAVLWSYDRLSPDAVAEVVQTFTGEHIADRSSYGVQFNISVMGEDGIGDKPVSPTYQFQNHLMGEYADWKRHSTVVQTMGRLRPHNVQPYRRDFIVALKGDMPLVFDNMVRWSEIDRAMTRQDWAAELQELLEKAPLPHSFEYADKIHPGRFKNKDDLNWYLKTRAYADEEGTPLIVVPLKDIYIRATTICDVPSEVNDIGALKPSVGAIAFRIAGSAGKFIDVLHAEESDKIASEKLTAALSKSGIRKNLEFKHDVYAPLITFDDAPVGAKAIAVELGVTRGQANNMSRAIKAGALSDTHNLIYIQGMRNGKKFGNEIPRAIKRNFSAAEIIRLNRERYPFDGFVIRWCELEEQPT